MGDQRVEEKPKPNLEAYQALVEVDKKERSFKARESYFRAYIFSIILPPIGIYYFVKYIFFADGTNDDIKAGIISLILTFASLSFGFLLLGLFFKQSTSNIRKQNIDSLKELITPENQKKLKDLFQ